ncbi:MAG: LysR family transcriptional regulator [Eubacteriales bacterium]|nr:LysR family transcriptional regulator [Eubacteriales bacterium]
MEFRQLEAFCAVVENRTYAAAAASLQVTQPTISIHLQSLEESLGATLIDRSHKPAVPTPLGREMYLKAKKILELRATMMRMTQIDLKQTLVIGASPIAAVHFLPNALGVLHKNMSSLQFEVHEGDSLEIINMVKNHDLQVAISGVPTEEPDLRCHKIGHDEIVIAMPNTEYYQQIIAGDFPWERLYAEPIILRDRSSSTVLQSIRYLQEQGIDDAELNVSVHLNSNEAIRHAIRQGLGISFMSQIDIQADLDSGELLAIPMGPDHLIREFFMIYPLDFLSDPKINHAIQVLKTCRFPSVSINKRI